MKPAKLKGDRSCDETLFRLGGPLKRLGGAPHERIGILISVGGRFRDGDLLVCSGDLGGEPVASRSHGVEPTLDVLPPHVAGEIQIEDPLSLPLKLRHFDPEFA